MKRLKALLCTMLAVSMVMSTIAGCSASKDISGKSTEKATESTAKTESKYETLDIGILVGSSAMPVLYAQDQGWFDELGLDVNLITFPTGAPINEAFAADQLDIASLGAAGIFAMATGECSMIGEPNTASGGVGIYVRPDSEILNYQGENSVYPNGYGNADVIKDLEVMLPLGTVTQYILLQWARGFGLSEAELKQIHMEYPAGYQAFVAGEGDAVGSTPPYCFDCINDGYVEITGSDQNFLTDMIVARDVVIEERREEVVLFLEAFYRACEALTDDELRSEYCMDKYIELGSEYTKETMDQEISVRDYIDETRMVSGEYTFGGWLRPYSEFYISTEKLTQEQVEIIMEQVDVTMLEDALDIDLSEYMGF